MSLAQAIRRAIRIVPRSEQYRLLGISVAGALAAVLDVAAILLLVPLLTYLGGGSMNTTVPGRWISDHLASQSASGLALTLALAATLLFIVKGLVSIGLLWVQTGTLNRLQVQASQQVLESYVGSDWLDQQVVGAGELIRTTVSSVSSTVQIVACSLSIFGDIAVFSAVLAALIIIDPILAGGALVYLAIAGLIYLELVRRPVRTRGALVQQQTERMNASLVELVGGIREITVRGTGEYYIDRFVVASRRSLVANRLLSVINASLRFFLELLMVGGAALVMAAVLMFSSDTKDALVSIGVLLAAGLRLLPALNSLLLSVNTIRACEYSLDLVESHIGRPPEVRRGSHSHACSSIGTSLDDDLECESEVPLIQVDEMSFQYPSRDVPALVDISFSVAVGETVGIVGATGSGKSTLMDLLLGMLVPDSGSIRVGGRKLDLPAVKHEWARSIGFVPQDVFVANDTIMANVVFGHDREESRDLAWSAIAAAQLEDFVLGLPESINTVLGERGVSLSGGQRQRIGIARAMFGSPTVLFLDEATSALDSETERDVTATLRGLHGDVTMIVIAHRMSTVRDCDKLIFLQDGRVSGCGSFRELYRTNREFNRLVRISEIDGAV